MYGNTNKQQRVKELKTHVKVLQAKLVDTKRREGKDDYIDVKVKKNQGRFERVKKQGVEDRTFGNYYLQLDIATKQSEVFIPLSVASGKKTAGFMYQIEGTAEGSIVTTDVRVRGDGISQVTIGILRFAKIPAGKTATFELRATIRGRIGKQYKLVFTRLNYKLRLADARYEQYLKEIHSDSVSFM